MYSEVEVERCGFIMKWVKHDGGKYAVCFILRTVTKNPAGQVDYTTLMTSISCAELTHTARRLTE